MGTICVVAGTKYVSESTICVSVSTIPVAYKY